MQENLKVIGWSAFYECGLLEEIHLPKGLTAINGFAFSSLKSVELPPRLSYMHPDAFRSAEFLSFDMVEGNGSYTTIDGVLYTADKKTSVSFPEAREGHYKIPESAFEKCIFLERAVIPESVMEIGPGAFQDCPLAEVVINRDCKVDPSAFGEQVKVSYY